MNTSLNLRFNNTYQVRLIDSCTGATKQCGEFHNIVTKGLLPLLIGTTRTDNAVGSSLKLYNMMSYLAIGTGTTTPSVNDSALVSQVSNPIAAQGAYKFEWVDDYTGRCTKEYIFPATPEYTGNITEVGLFGSYYTSADRLTTRALLTDSEGQVISFNKTDTDILNVTVTVELTIVSSSTHFSIIKKPYMVYNILTGMVGNLDYYFLAYGGLNLCRFYTDLDIFRVRQGTGIRNPVIDHPLMLESVSKLDSGGTSGYVEWPVTRFLATDVTSETYYKALAIPSIGYWRLPNESIFPAYTISNIPVGTGDGVTTQFENPLCYFKKNTDKVYKNGVRLTRGVDYVLNNISNSKGLPEVAEMIKPIKVFSEQEKKTTRTLKPLIVPTANVYSYTDGEGYGEPFSVSFSRDYPLLVEYAEPVTLNCMKCVGPFLQHSSSTGSIALPIGTLFYLDYSTDGVTYVEIGSVATSDNTGSFVFDFDSVTAKYWRIRTSLSNSNEVGIALDSSSANAYLTLNYKDPYITFTTAPAAGDVITMDVDMDIIMKNSNFVVDVGCRLTFSI